MEQIVVNVSGLSVEEKQKVNEALAKITGLKLCDPRLWSEVNTMYVPSHTVTGDVCIYHTDVHYPNTHTPQQVLEMAGMTNRGHVHAESMALYAEDAKTTDKPWRLWQVRDDVGGEWIDLVCNPSFPAQREYRRKPKTKLIHGVGIPDIGIDLSLTKGRTEFYTPCTHNSDLFIGLSHDKHNDDYSRLSTLGLTYPYTEEGKHAAILHTKAMLSIA